MFNLSELPTTQLLPELERFLVFWLGEWHEEYGEPVDVLDRIAMPDPLRRLYAFAGRWPTANGCDEESPVVGLFSTQDALWRPEHLKRTEDGKIEFIIENQGVWSLATLPKGEDPTVWVDSEGLGIETDEKWTKANDSLTKLLVTFCLQELTFGAKFGVWDDDLTKYFRGGGAKVEPILLGGQYMWPEPQYNFYLMDHDVLVGQFLDDDCFFGANCESGIARLKARESPIVTIRISTPTDWTLEIREDGSGEVCVFMNEQSVAEIPPGTFQFAPLRDAVLAQIVENADCRQVAVVFLMRSGRGYSEGQGVADQRLIRQLFERSFGAVRDKKTGFDKARRTVPLGIA